MITAKRNAKMMPPAIQAIILLALGSTWLCTYQLWHSTRPLTSSTPQLYAQAYFEVNDPKNGVTWPYRVFKSSTLQPPLVKVTGNQPPNDRYSLLVNSQGRGNGRTDLFRSPYVFRMDGELLYSPDLSNSLEAANVWAQSIKGEPFLTFWEGNLTSGKQVGHAYGNVVIVDKHGRSRRVSLHANVDHNLNGPTVGLIDSHEQRLTDQNTVLVTAYNNTPYDLTSVGGPGRDKGWVVDSMIFEIDLDTEEVVFSWSSLAHIPVSASRLPLNLTTRGEPGNGDQVGPYDYFHINSIEPVGRDALLINGRHTWSTYLISRTTGEILWEYNGETGGDWAPPKSEEAKHRWAHDARVVSANDGSIVISWFDNHHSSIKGFSSNVSSAGLILELPLPPSRSRPARLVERVEMHNGSQLLAESQGSFDIDKDGAGGFLGFGNLPSAADIGPSPRSEILWHAQFGYDNVVSSYRARKQEWHSTPSDWSPSLVIEEVSSFWKTVGLSSLLSARVVRCFVSWNGATDVEAWHVFEVIGGQKQLVGVADWKGFETTFEVPLTRHGCIRVAAVVHAEMRFSELACL